MLVREKRKKKKKPNDVPVVDPSTLWSASSNPKRPGPPNESTLQHEEMDTRREARELEARSG